MADWFRGVSGGAAWFHELQAVAGEASIAAIEGLWSEQGFSDCFSWRIV